MRYIRGVMGCVLIGVWVSVMVFGAGCADLRGETVRLHVVAHSDSDADQALKLKVRDAVCAATAELLDGCTVQGEALSRLREALPAIERVAAQCIAEAGYAYPVTAELTTMRFTTRTYDSGTFPAGVYEALRVTIGEGSGRNWWCVVYPPLCVSAAMAVDESPLSDAAVSVIRTPRYAVRFKIVEWVERWRKPKG